MKPRGVAAILLLVARAAAEQLTFGTSLSSLEEQEHALSETLVTALSDSTQHGTFVHLLQRSKLVPVLSRLNGTVFAPTDDAWKKWDEEHRPEDGKRVFGWLGAQGIEEWLVDDASAEQELSDRLYAAAADEDKAERIRAEADNQNWALRQHLLYHILNYTIAEKDWAPNDDNNVTIETTLLFPEPKPHTPSPTPVPGTPWTPGPGEGLLGSHGQRLRVALPGSAEGGERGLVGFDHFGIGGASVWDGAGWDHPDPNNTHLRYLDTFKDKDKKRKYSKGARWVRNGVVVGVDSVMAPPMGLMDTLRSIPQLSYLAKLLDTTHPLPQPLPPWLGRAPHVTLFAASDTAFGDSFDNIERGYLEGGFGAEGLGRVLSPAMLLNIDGKNAVGWSDTWGKKTTNVTTVSDMLEISAKNRTLVVNGTEAEIVDIFTANGVVHVLPKLLLPTGFELLNSAEKVLLSRNATRFVSLMRSANLSSTYIGEPGKNTKKEWTILAPTDEAINYMEWLGARGLMSMDVMSLLDPATLVDTRTDNVGIRPPYEDTSPLAKLLQYHIVPGNYGPNDIKDGMLLGTELRTKELAGSRQRLQVEVSERREPGSDWDVEDGEISFGGAMVVGSPVKSGDSVIYLISAILSPPLDVLQTGVADLQLSTYIAAVYAAGLERSVKRSPATTFFIPRNKAFNNLGLAMQYLLLPEGRDELRKVIRYHAVDKILYTTDMEVGLTVLKTVEGGNIVLDQSKNRSFTLRSPTKWEGHDSGISLPSNGELRPAFMRNKNALTETGVIHIIDSVVLPSDVHISISKLIRGSKQRTMAELMVKAGLGWILEGREPTDEEVERTGLSGIVQTQPLGSDGPACDNPGSGDDPADVALPAYTLLVPTDKAFSRINLTHYLSDQGALLELLKLHIIPSNFGAKLPKASTEHAPKYPPSDNTPLALEDDVVYPTLLSSSTKYGELAFRLWGEDDFLVGVRNARGGASDRPARTGHTGRASVRWKRAWCPDVSKQLADTNLDDDDNLVLWRGGMTLGGGVIVIDSVLEPYHPGWFTRWGWLVFTIFGAVAGVILLGVSGWWWWRSTKQRQEGYDRVAASEEEARQEEANRHWRRQSRGGQDNIDEED